MTRAVNDVKSTPASGRARVNGGWLWPILAWSFVGLPAAWGVSQTARQAVALFRAPTATSTPAATHIPSPAPSVDER